MKGCLMKLFKFLMCLCVVFLSLNSNAQMLAQKTQGEEKQTQISEYIKESLSYIALKNVTDAEQVFCYTVTKAPKDFNGYTVDQMAITGFCGIFEQQEKEIFINELFKNENHLSKAVAQCRVEPNLLFRFVRGIDYTDVLLSQSCPSMTVFYAGKVKSFNAEPSVELINAYVSVYEPRSVDFVSPTLLNQLMPIGLPQTDAQKALVASKNNMQQQPVRSWTTSQEPAATQQAPSSGWNRINMNRAQ